MVRRQKRQNDGFTSFNPSYTFICANSLTKRSIESLVFVSVTQRSILLFSSGYNAEMSNPQIIPFVRRCSLILFMRRLLRAFNTNSLKNGFLNDGSKISSAESFSQA